MLLLLVLLLCVAMALLVVAAAAEAAAMVVPLVLLLVLVHAERSTRPSPLQRGRLRNSAPALPQLQPSELLRSP